MTPHPNDFGPIYAETLPGLLAGSSIVEPWNVFSNLVFLAIVIYMTWRTKLSVVRHPLIVAGLPVLLVGWFGGTLYHATRSHSAWLIMDFVPIVLLTTAAAVVFWKRVVNSWLVAVSLFLGIAISGRLVAGSFGLERSVMISLGYASTGLAILLPLICLVKRRAWRDLPLLSAVIVSFVVAVTCRVLDRPGLEPLLPMGTHFLWHLFGGISVWCLMELTVRLESA